MTSVTSTGNTSTSTSQQNMDNFIGTRDDFLTILLAQLKHQDPLSPMEGTEFIDSITRLSSVEQGINQNSTLERIESLLSANGNQDLGNPVSYIDKNIDFLSDNFLLENGSGDIEYIIEDETEAVFIVIKDTEGNNVFSELGNTQVGKNSFTWDGKDENGQQFPDGQYVVEVSYLGEDDELVDAPTATKGLVTAASFQGDEVVLNVGNVGNISVSLDDIISIRSSENGS